MGGRMNKSSNWDIISTVIVIAIATIPFVEQFLGGEETSVTGIILLGIILIIVVFYFIYTYIKKSIVDYTSCIKNNTHRIEQLEQKIEYKKDFYTLDKRISILEANHEKKRPD